MLWNSPQYLEGISRELGTQALIANMPVRADGNHLYWRNYLTQSENCLNEKALARLPLEWVSELMLTDWIHEGVSNGFDSRILELFPLDKKPIILFGGLS
jgi:hypothetical protein